MFKITVCCLKWGSKTTSLSCLSYCVCIEGCNGCDEQWKVYYGTSFRCYHQNTSGFVVFVLIYWLKTRGTIWIILLLLTARSTTTIIIVSSSGFILVSNFCRARCSLFVLKVPLNSNQPTEPAISNTTNTIFLFSVFLSFAFALSLSLSVIEVIEAAHLICFGMWHVDFSLPGCNVCNVVAQTVQHAIHRKQFGRPLTDFGLIQVE